MSDLRIVVKDTDLDAGAEGTFMAWTGSKRGEAFIIDFYDRMMSQGRCFQVRAGTITTPIAGDVVITNSAAEMATSANLGTTFIPINTNIAMRLNPATLMESAGKSIGTIHTIGTAFVALPLKTGGSAAANTFSTCATAGGVAVAAELATNTRRHWSWSQPIIAGAYQTTYDWSPRMPPLLTGPACYYVQIAATTTAPDYYASYDFIEMPSSLI